MSTTSPHQEVQALYCAHHGWLQGWLRRRLGNRHDAADLAQDTFVRLLRLDQEQRPQELTRPRAYLAAIANRLMLNLYRRRSLESAYLEILAQLPETQVPSPEYGLQILEVLHELDAILARLEPKVRQAFLMAQLMGSSQQDIARHLDVSVRTVQRYITTAYAECIVLASSTPEMP